VVEAAKKYNRIVQHGTQSRSNSTLIRDIGLIHKGFIGKIMHSRGYVYKNGNRFAIATVNRAHLPITWIGHYGKALHLTVRS
jgi:hypothetical protein